VVDLASAEVVGHEALTRFDDGLSAERWLAEAIAAGEEVALEGKMARAAIRAAAGLPQKGWLAIKTSSRLLHSDGELRHLLSGLVRPVLVEITEPATSDVLPELRELRRIVPPKALITLEHAGLGHKTLTVLLELRPAYIKLDRDAIAGLTEDGARQVQLANLVKVANECGCSVVVAGVETEEQRRLLCKLGASLGQGYLFGRPEPVGPPRAEDGPAPEVDRALGLTAPAPSAVLRPDGDAEGDGHRRRLSLVRTLVAAAVIAAAVYGGAEKLPSAVAAAYATKSATWFAPYVDATLTPSYSFQDRSLDPARQVVLGFVVSAPGAVCAPSWGAAYGFSQADQALALGPRLAELGQEGVGAVVSFGGRANTDLAEGCTNVPSLERAYQSVVSHYRLRTIDLDVEGAALSDAAAAQRRAAAVAGLQAAAARQHRPVRVWLTLPVEPDGLQSDAISVIDAMLRARVSLAGINIMTMDFRSPPATGQTMLDLVQQAASAVHTQLQVQLARYGVSLGSPQVWQRMGITVMIGQNDIPGEIFTTDDAQGLVRFVNSNGIGRVSMWSLNRDSECGQAFGESGILSDACSGTPEQSLAFSQLFTHLSGVTTAAIEPTGIIAPAPDTNAANALYPLWSPTAEYQAGYKVVRNGYIYGAKWYNAGEDPAQLWPSSSESPWELLGPVLPSDRAPKMPVLPAGTYPTWSPVKAYDAGDRVLYQGLAYEAKWYNEGASPGEEAADPFGSAWQPLFTFPGEPSYG
jgi:chitinase